MGLRKQWGAWALLGGALAASHASAQTVDVLTNGSFSAGNTAFATNYEHTTVQGALSGAGGEGRYGIGDNPNYYHSKFIPSLAPYPAGATRAMIINGALGSGLVTWQQSVQLAAGVPYTFTGSVTSVVFVLGPQNLAGMNVELSDSPGACPALTVGGTGPAAGYSAVTTMNAAALTGGAASGDPVPPSWVTATGTATRSVAGDYCLRIRNTVTVWGGNDFAITGLSLTAPKPLAANDGYTTPYNTTLPVPAATAVGVNDTQLPPNPQYSALTSPGNGTLAFNADGTFSYAPNSGFSGADSFTYRVCSGPGGLQPCSDPATVTIVVGNPPAVTPTPQADAYTQTAPGAPVTGNVGGNDTNIPATPEYSVVGAPPPGLTFNSNGTFSYTPPAGTTGPVTFDYQLCSGPGQVAPCATATVTITLAAAPTAPTAVPTMGWWGLMALSALLGLFGVTRRRHA